MTILHNPLLPGFHPDPSITRVGEDFVLVTSSFEYLPGLPVHRSRDLVHWELIGHVADRLGQLDVEKVPTLGGAWAPTVRHHDGLWYVIVTDALGRGNLVFTAERPEGPWSDGAVLDGINGIDPDLAWDTDGTCFVTYSALRLTGDDLGSHHGIEQVRVDLATSRTLEEPRSMWSGTGLQFPEAPHLYLIDGTWYLMIAEGGTERGHGVSIARSDRPDGEFVGCPANPVLSARSTSRPIQNTGHGDLIQLADGSWAMVLLGMRPRGMTRAFSPMGRETFVTALTWVDGWPVVEPVQLTPVPEGSADATVVYEDDFTGDVLAPEWIAVRRLPADIGSLTERPGSLVLHGDGTTMDDPQPVFVGRGQEHHRAGFSAVIEPIGAGRGGLSIRYDEQDHYDIEYRRNSEAGAGTVTARARLGGIEQTWEVPAPAGPLTLTIDCVPTQRTFGPAGAACDLVGLGFATAAGRVTVAEVDGRYLAAETAASFTGRIAGMYAVDGTVAFRDFRYEGTAQS